MTNDDNGVFIDQNNALLFVETKPVQSYLSFKKAVVSLTCLTVQPPRRVASTIHLSAELPTTKIIGGKYLPILRKSNLLNEDLWRRRQHPCNANKAFA